MTRLTAATNAGALRPDARVTHRESDGRGSGRQPRRVPVAAGRHRRSPQPDRPAQRRGVCRHRQPRRECRPPARRLRRGGHGLRPYGVPRGRADRPRAGPRRLGGVDLAAPRRLQPRARRARAAARGGRRGSDRRRARPQAARVAVAEAPARDRRDDLGHRPARDRPRDRRVRPGPARRGPPGARGQHRRHAGPPPGLRRARRPRRQPPDVRQRPRLRLARGLGRGQDPGGAAGRRLPRRGRPPRRPAYAAHRPPHALPGTPGRAVHAAGQRVGPVSAVANRAPLLRHPAADARVPGRPLGGRGARRPRGALLHLRQPG